ncbi:MAG: nucleotidyltransferase domain-containing protein [Cytophagaceae bacterium]|nr:nucleotidyltransferase domain-containing protein [Cytophagaceae bacterium]
MTRKEEIRQLITQVLARQLAGRSYRAFLFGSQANRDELKRADIDVGIWADEALPEVLLAQISDELHELPTLYPFDVVDFNRTQESFRQVALQRTEPL